MRKCGVRTVCFFLSRSESGALCVQGDIYFEQALRHCLLVDFDSISPFCSERIALSDSLESSPFLSPGGAKIFGKLRSKISKTPKIAKKFVRPTSYR